MKNILNSFAVVFMMTMTLSAAQAYQTRTGQQAKPTPGKTCVLCERRAAAERAAQATAAAEGKAGSARQSTTTTRQ